MEYTKEQFLIMQDIKKSRLNFEIEFECANERNSQSEGEVSLQANSTNHSILLYKSA